MRPADAVTLGIILFAAVTLLQVPLWIAKHVFRWRLTHGTDDPGPWLQGPWQFNLQHLLLGTFLLAVALSPLHRVLPPEPVGHLHLARNLPTILAAAIVYNLLVTIPCIWGAFVSRAAVVPLAFVWLVYCGILTGVEFGALVAVLGSPGPRPGETFLFFCL